MVSDSASEISNAQSGLQKIEEHTDEEKESDSVNYHPRKHQRKRSMFHLRMANRKVHPMPMNMTQSSKGAFDMLAQDSASKDYTMSVTNADATGDQMYNGDESVIMRESGPRIMNMSPMADISLDRTNEISGRYDISGRSNL